MEKRPRSILVLGWVVGVLYLLRVSLLIPAKLAKQALSSTAEPVLIRMWGLVSVGVASRWSWGWKVGQHVAQAAPGVGGLGAQLLRRAAAAVDP